MAPHDWTPEGYGYGDLRALVPPINRYENEFQKNLSTLCEAVPLTKQAEMKRSYYSCIQYIDHLVGQLIGALKTNNLYEVRIVSIDLVHSLASHLLTSNILLAMLPAFAILGHHHHLLGRYASLLQPILDLAPRSPPLPQREGAFPFLISFLPLGRIGTHFVRVLMFVACLTDHGYKLGEHCDWFKHGEFTGAATPALPSY
jgi:hypothetical protein